MSSTGTCHSVTLEDLKSFIACGSRLTGLPLCVEALRAECFKLCEENEVLKKCLRLMRDNSTLECATLMTAVIAFCDSKFRLKFSGKDIMFCAWSSSLIVFPSVYFLLISVNFLSFS